MFNDEGLSTTAGWSLSQEPTFAERERERERRTYLCPTFALPEAHSL